MNEDGGVVLYVRGGTTIRINDAEVTNDVFVIFQRGLRCLLLVPLPASRGTSGVKIHETRKRKGRKGEERKATKAERKNGPGKDKLGSRMCPRRSTALADLFSAIFLMNTRVFNRGR